MKNSQGEMATLRIGGSRVVAIVQGSLAYFGTYSVSETDKTITSHIESSTFPNWNGWLIAERCRKTQSIVSVARASQRRSLYWRVENVFCSIIPKGDSFSTKVQLLGYT
jgi:hypothetical protein